MRPLKYVLDGKTPVPSDDPWAVEKAIGTKLALSFIEDARISTVFLAIDHGLWLPEPVLFETMIFGGELDGLQWRYSTWDEAIAGHHTAVKQVENAVAERAPAVSDAPPTLH